MVPKSYSSADVTKALKTGHRLLPSGQSRWSPVRPKDRFALAQKPKSRRRHSRHSTPRSASISIAITIFSGTSDGTSTRPRQQRRSLASDKPIDETYHGRYAFSEPETRNVAWVFDQFPRIRWYMDIHSAEGEILFNWGDDNDQFE